VESSWGARRELCLVANCDRCRRANRACRWHVGAAGNLARDEPQRLGASLLRSAVAEHVRKCIWAARRERRFDGSRPNSPWPFKPTGVASRCLARSQGGPYVRAMQNLKIWILFSSLLMGSAACQGDQDDEAVDRTVAAERERVVPRLVPHVPPPVELGEPPADATKTASGLVYKKLATKHAGAQAKASDTVLVHYTGWRQRTGETFFTTRARGRPIAIDIAHAAPGFAEALPLLHKGEKAVLWVPPSQDAAEPLVYEIEVVDVMAPAAVAKRASPPGVGAAQGAHR
jgi:hypothetical protein